MTIEDDFIQDGKRKALLDDFLSEELERAGYDGFTMQETTEATQFVITVDKPGMVIGKGGQNIRELTEVIENKFDFENVEIDVQEVENPDLSPNIIADRLANALERGWYFRSAGQETIERIMEQGAQGAEITFSGKLSGARSRTEQFKRGHIKHNGEPAQTIVETGQSEAVLQLGTIGVTVKLIPPNAELPDDHMIHDDVDIEEELTDTIDELTSEE